MAKKSPRSGGDRGVPYRPVVLWNNRRMKPGFGYSPAQLFFAALKNSGEAHEIVAGEPVMLYYCKHDSG